MVFSQFYVLSIQLFTFLKEINAFCFYIFTILECLPLIENQRNLSLLWKKKHWKIFGNIFSVFIVLPKFLVMLSVKLQSNSLKFVFNAVLCFVHFVCLFFLLMLTYFVVSLFSTCEFEYLVSLRYRSPLCYSQSW